MNPMMLLQNFIKRGLSPQQVLSQIGANNPMITNLMNMINNGDTKGVETFARNMFKERGRDFDKEFAEFRSNFKQ
jgi:hypothetical protein